MAIRLALFYAAVFLFVGVALPFWPVWLTAKGLSATEIGLTITAGAWVRIAAPALAAHVADRRGRRRGVLILLAGTSLAAHLLFLIAEGFAALLAVSILAAIVFTPIIPMGENMTLLASRARRFDYGRVRLWGSIAFIAGAILGGRAVGDAGADAILWLVLGTLALTVLAALAMPETGSPPARRHVPLAALLSDPPMIVFLVTASLIQASHAAAYGFATLAWRESGIDDDVIGLLWAEGVLAEIVLFALGGGLAARLGPARMLAIAAAAGIVRWVGLAVEPGLGWLVALQALHALTFGAAHLGAMLYLVRAIPPEHSASAQALYSGASMGLVMGGATILAGALYDDVGAGAFYAMAAMSAGGLAGAALLARVMPSVARSAGSRA
ncbi:MAG: 3-phenylpropionate MFS transporter [Defluviicoccus sp.]|nr:3-phenylpropionate MFS transporter [Defluviicoccus sp.]